MSQGGVGDPNFRASDADRDRIVEQLRQHTADGRLTMDEFEQRMSAAYAAKTYGELAELTRDLPVDLGARGKTQQGAAAWGSPQDAVPPAGSWTTYGQTRPNTPNTAAGDIAAAVIGAAMEWKLQRHAMREQVRAQMREQRRAVRLAKRQAQGPASAFAAWAGLSILLTGIWFMTGLLGGGWSDFWPAWPIGILGFLMLGRVVAGLGQRR
jgi:Domain of unknown function (DUF1707)